MTIQIPGAVQWLVPIVVGADWPEGDEDALRRLSGAWEELAGTLGLLGVDGNSAAETALQCMQGDTADAFAEYWEKFVSGDPQYLPELERLAAQLAESCDSTATEVEYTKLAIIAALIILAAQIAAMIASAFATFGASTAGIPIAQAATRITVQMVFQQLIKQILINVGINVGTDFAIQAGQLMAGGRDSWDLGKTGEAAVSGVAAGIASAGVGVASAGLGNTTENFVQAAGRGAVEGAGEGVGGNVLNDAFHGNAPSADSVISGVTSGSVGGALDGMSNRHEGLDTTWHDTDHPEYTAGENTQGHPFRTEDGAEVRANTDDPYSRDWNSGNAQDIPHDSGPNQVNVHDDEPQIDETPQVPEDLTLPRP